MGSFTRHSNSDYASRLQALEASLTSRSRTPQPPPSPPVVATSGVPIAVENSRTVRNKGFDFKKAIGEGSSKGKGEIHESGTGVRRDGDRNPNIRAGNSRNAAGNGARVYSPVIRSQETVRPAQVVGERSSKVNAVAGKFNGDVLYRLYFKGLVSDQIGKMTNVVAGFGVAICDLKDNLLFEMKGPLVNRGPSRQEAEIKALTRGLTEALKLGIKHIAFFCASFPIFQYVTGRWAPKQKKISMLMSDLQQMRQQFTASQPALVAGNDVKFAYKLARESIVSQVTPHVDPRQAKASRKEECVICYNGTGAESMFSVNKCRHRFCIQCVKQHVEVKLLQGMVPKCPHDGCKSQLVIDACGQLLTPKLREMWERRIKEDAIPVTDRVYCPFQRCSALMSRTKISETANSLLSVYPTSGVRRCVECRGLFCVDCKVPWHGKLSCTEYKKLHPNPPADDVKLESLANNKMWRQCSKCQHMIELTQGCNHMTCRCGFEFCYNCGGVWNKKLNTCAKRCPALNMEYIMRQDPALAHMEPNYYFDDSDEDEYEDEEEYDYLAYGRAMMNDLGLEIPEDFDPFFDLPDGTLFYPHMLSPKTRRRFYEADDDSDEMEPGQSHFPHNSASFGNVPPADDDSDEMEPGQSHFPHNNAPSGNVPPAAEDDDKDCDYLAYGRAMMNDLGLEIPEDFDPFFDLPDGTLFHPNMLSPKTRRRFYEENDDSDEMESHFPHNNGPFGNAPPPADDDDDDDDCPYFGKYGKYTTVYDSDGYEIEDYTNPFHPDYPHF